MNTPYGKRLKALRESHGHTQDHVSKLLGISHRQTLANIEAGTRQMSAQELIRATEVFDVPLEYFTDAFAVAGEASFSWRRHAEVSQEDITNFEARSGRLFGAYRSLSQVMGFDHRRLADGLNISPDAAPETATAIGEEMFRDTPRDESCDGWLEDAIEERFGIPILNLDAPRDLSGAVCHLEDMDGIVVNRSDVPGRRNFDLAHELFHALTWATMPPEHIETISETPKAGRLNRVENLADNFASGLLMPTHLLASQPGWDDLPVGDEATITWLNTTATRLGVSSMALARRMTAIGRLQDSVRRRLMRSPRMKHNGGDAPPPPLAYGRMFVGLLTEAIQDGRISTRGSAALVGLDVDAFGDLCEEWGFDRSAI